jgi:hypothetical protein
MIVLFGLRDEGDKEGERGGDKGGAAGGVASIVGTSDFSFALFNLCSHSLKFSAQ